MAGRLLVELESIQLKTKTLNFFAVKSFAVLDFKNESKRGQFRTLQAPAPDRGYHWGETFDFDVEADPKADKIWVSVYKEKSKFDKKIGGCEILLYDATVMRGEPSRCKYQLTDKKSGGSSTGEVTIVVRFYRNAPQLQAALQHTQNEVLRLERELKLKTEVERALIVSGSPASTRNTAPAPLGIGGLTATVRKVEQWRLQTQLMKLENEMKWAEIETRWEENRAKWAENDAKRRENSAEWEKNRERWEANDARWLQTALRISEGQAKQTYSMLETCKESLKTDIVNFGHQLHVMIVAVKVWFSQQ